VAGEEEAVATRPTRTTERRPAHDGRPELEVVRSTRRRRTVTAFPRDGRIVVQLPAGLPVAEEERLIARLVDRVTGRARARAAGGDAELAARAADLADRYVDGVRPTSVAWSSRMATRYGSCTPGDGSLRLSDRLAACPAYVVDAVLVHELAHLLEPGHGPAFRAIVARYPDLDRAEAFLAGMEFGSGRRSLDGPVASGAASGGPLDDDLAPAPDPA
jgi:hypothetical protein